MPIELCNIELKGDLGKALRKTLNNRLKTLDYDLLVEPYAKRYENDNAWRCEFWGKVVRSAILVNAYMHDSELSQKIEKTVRDIMATQTPDGCISTYPEDKQTGGWDIWGRKYVLLGLIRYYDLVNPDPAVVKCCTRLVDHLVSQLKSKGLRFIDCGAHDGLAACSILGAIVGVYRISGEKKYLDLAKDIAESGCSLRHNIYHAAMNGVHPCEIGNAKAYEMTSCFQGLAELHALDEIDYAPEACLKYYDMVKDREIFVTGIGGSKDVVGELWNDTAFKQTRTDAGGMGETCVTTTWIHYCERILEMTEMSAVADEIEKSLYNGILGATANGSDWTHKNPTPLIGGGCKLSAPDQIGGIFKTPYGGNDCCRAQGPEGIACALRFAVKPKESGAFLNIFEPLSAVLPSGTKIEVSGNYPYFEKATVKVISSGEFCLSVRTPDYLKKIVLNGKKIHYIPRQYCNIQKIWTADDTLELWFDLSLREMYAPDGSPFISVKSGPLVLAEDFRKGELPCDAAVYEWRNKKLVTYAAAGNEMSEDNTLTVWFQTEK